MGGLQMKGVCQKGDRLYLRRKVKGKDVYIRLPAADDPTFAEEYARARHPGREREEAKPGSIAALVEKFRASADHRNVPSAKTRNNRARYLDLIAKEHGHRSVKGIRAAHLWTMRDNLADTPGKANNYLAVMRLLMAFAAKHDWRSDNPAIGIPALKLGEHEPWPADVLERALAAATPMMRLIIISGLCGGVRVGDAIRMQHGWHDGRTMQFFTSKNKVDVAIPMHPLWQEEIAKMPRRAVTILYDRSGKPFSTTGAIQSRIRRLMSGIGAEGFTFHGLRKNACCYLVGLGLSDAEVGAILGMSPEIVRYYSKRAKSLMLANNVADRVRSGTVLKLPTKAKNSA